MTPNTPLLLSRRWLGPVPWAWEGWVLAAIVATSFIYNRWMLDARIFFFADDWQWLWRAEFSPWSDSFYSILPSTIYNDRPVGAAIVKGLYGIFGLNHRAFQIVLLSLHAINCFLLYAIAKHYAGRAGALVAALLAAVWFAANDAVGWVAAIFDLAGATLCLATILFRQISRRSGDTLRYDLAGAACYLLATRTKEFALGMIAVLFLMNYIVEKQNLRATVRQLWPYTIVFLVYAARYAQLFQVSHPSSGSLYHLDFSLSAVVTSLGFYVATILNGNSGVHFLGAASLIVAMGVAMLLQDDHIQRVALWSLMAFVILLGPVLLMPAQTSPLYLYAPHFLLSLAIGVLLAQRGVALVLVAVIVAGITVPPMRTGYRHSVIDYYLDHGKASQGMFDSALKLLTPLPPGATVFISGVPPASDLFSVRPGNALRTAFRDFNLTVDAEGPETELETRFCGTQGAKRFLRFEGTRSAEVTVEVAGRCDTQDQD